MPRARKPPVPASLKELFKRDSSEVSNDDLVHGLLTWTLHHATNYPEQTSVGQVAECIKAAAMFREAGGGDDGGMGKFLSGLEVQADKVRAERVAQGAQ